MWAGLNCVQVTPGNLDYVAESIHEAVNKFQWPIGEIFVGISCSLDPDPD